MRTELDYVRAAAEALKKLGTVFIGYITAELEPYSSQQKPDISFVPKDGPNSGKVFFIELRFFEGGKLPRQFENALLEAKSFALEGTEGEFGGFAFACNATVEPATIHRLAESGIHVFGNIKSGEMLAEVIRGWATEVRDGR